VSPSASTVTQVCSRAVILSLRLSVLTGVTLPQSYAASSLSSASIASAGEVLSDRFDRSGVVDPQPLRI
jgi:hypothetical protein